MPYVRMKLEYFKILENMLSPNVYIKMYLNAGCVPTIEVVEYNDGEKIIMRSDISKSVSKNILDLIHEMSTRINDGIPVFPQYARTAMRRKTLDNVISLDYIVYFFKTTDNMIIGTISKETTKDIYDVFITRNESVKKAFEALDSEIYNRFGFYPNIPLKEEGTLTDYTDKLVKERIKFSNTKVKL